MKLKTISIKDLKKDLKKDNIFINIPFLYSPFLKELKKLEKEIISISIEIDNKIIFENEVILSFLRLFGIPEEIDCSGEQIKINYLTKEIIITFTKSERSYSGEIILSDCILTFYEDCPFISKKYNNGEDSIIVLPEGDGSYYMDLDKNESENEERRSIIGDPYEMKYLYSWILGKTIG